MSYNAVLSFWFNEVEQSQWWVPDLNLDAEIKTRFLSLHQQACQCELFEWRSRPHGRLAEIIVLDQFSRNIFRDTPHAFESDRLALALAQEAVSLGIHTQLNAVENSFLFMPYMHSESRVIHQTAVSLYQENGLKSSLDFELKHKTIIDRFGRYPHRNDILNRVSTAEEIEFLKQPNSSF